MKNQLPLANIMNVKKSGFLIVSANDMSLAEKAITTAKQSGSKGTFLVKQKRLADYKTKIDKFAFVKRLSRIKRNRD